MCLQEQLKDEVLDMSKKIAAAGFKLLVIDTESKFVSTGFAKVRRRGIWEGAEASVDRPSAHLCPSAPMRLPCPPLI